MAPAPAPAKDAKRCPEGMVVVAGGSFAFAGDGNSVTVADFCLDTYEVTVARYTSCLDAKGCTAEHVTEKCFGAECEPDATCNHGRADHAAHPMNCVDWSQARAFCNFYGHRLPTEEEHEWASRGGARASKYPWGTAALGPQLCWSDRGTERKETCPVGSFPSGDSPLGIHDLMGNVWEWCENSVGPDQRAMRGGSWVERPIVGVADIDATARSYNVPTMRGANLGFRCARTASP